MGRRGPSVRPLWGSWRRAPTGVRMKPRRECLQSRRGYSSTIVGWCSNGKRAKMQQGVKTWWRRSTLEVTTINLGDLLEVTTTSLEDLLEVTSTHTNTLVTRTLLCLQALQQPDQAAGVGLRELLQIQDLQTMRRSSDISVEDRLSITPNGGSTQLDRSVQCQISTSTSLCKGCKACMDASRVWAARVVDI